MESTAALAPTLLTGLSGAVPVRAGSDSALQATSDSEALRAWTRTRRMRCPALVIRPQHNARVQLQGAFPSKCESLTPKIPDAWAQPDA
jgi:hypothetical protein